MVVVILHTAKFGIDCISFYQPTRAYSFIGQQNHNRYGVWGRFWCIHSIHPLIWLSQTLELSSVLHYLVMRLLKNLLDSGWTVYMDNFYTSPILYTRTYCWTCQSNRKHFAKSIFPKENQCSTTDGGMTSEMSFIFRPFTEISFSKLRDKLLVKGRIITDCNYCYVLTKQTSWWYKMLVEKILAEYFGEC